MAAKPTFKGLLNTIQDFVIKNAPNSKILIEAANRRGVPANSSSLLELLETAAQNVSAQNMKKYKDAIAMATNPEDPNRQGIHELYKNLMLDNHLASVIDSRILYSQRSAYKMIDANGEENKDITNLLERQWFHDLMYKVLFHQFQGTTLLEMYHLDANGELLEIDEIPQTHFNPRKGIITEQVGGGGKAWNYREGVFAPYYVQIGKDNFLGMLEQLAPIVLAKKLGMGSWLDYIEKYGVPPLFITTDREDDKRLEELFNAASQFKSNQFMIGRGQEKFEVGQIGGAGTAPFDTLITRADDQMSKRVLGGAGLTDEKAFVGSAEIQFNLAKDRFESDKKLFRNIFNNIIKPKLIGLSPVYAPLANYTFAWDDTENMSKKDIIEAAAKLGSVFEIDPEWFYEQTGIPILGTKANGGQPGTPEPKK